MDSKAVTNYTLTLPGPEDLGSQPVKILPPLVKWDDRPVDWKQWEMMNISVELCIRMI